jgi:glycosyltransferase involved in cell wall biosynthesis
MITKTKTYNINENFSIIELPGRIAMGIGSVGYFFTKKPLFDLVLALNCKLFPKMLNRYLKHANESEILIFEGCWHFPLVQELKASNEKLIVYDARNVEYLLKKQVYSGIYKKLLLPKLFLLEKALCERSELVLVTCKEEKERFIELYSLNSRKVEVFPPGIVLPQNKKIPEKKSVIFIGGAYFANFEAAKFISTKLALELPEFKFRIVGRCSMGLKNLPSNVEVYGVVSEKEKDRLLRTSEIAINPITHGAGINVKMLEYMGYGMPIITTKLGSRGIVSERRAFLLAEINKFPESIKYLSRDPKLMEELSLAARETIRDNYLWERVLEGLSDLLMRKYQEKQNHEN